MLEADTLGEQSKKYVISKLTMARLGKFNTSRPCEISQGPLQIKPDLFFFRMLQASINDIALLLPFSSSSSSSFSLLHNDNVFL